MKIRVSRLFKIYFLRLNMCLHLRTKFYISSIILMTFRQRAKVCKGEGGDGGERRGSFNHSNLKANP